MKKTTKGVAIWRLRLTGITATPTGPKGLNPAKAIAEIKKLMVERTH